MKYFAAMPDHRHPGYVIHPLATIIGITIAAVICGAKDWYDVEDYGRQKQSWLSQFLDVSKGIPSHDTFNLFFQQADPQALEKCFIDWVSEIASLAEGRIVSIDGKTLRGSSESKKTGTFIHMVSAWCSHNSLVLGQVKTEAKSNEITAIPALLDLLTVKGCLISIDAMGCQVKIAEKIVSKEADYLLAVKDNQQGLLDDIREAFGHQPVTDWCKDSDMGHGRVETRRTWVIERTDWVCREGEWKKLSVLIKTECTRYDKKSGAQQTAERYYIGSRKASAQYYQQAIRAHWHVENKLHWMLDVTFGEDDSVKRAGHAAQNFSLISRVALNMVGAHQEKESRGAKQISTKRKRNMAAWNNDYLLEILLSLHSIT